MFTLDFLLRQAMQAVLTQRLLGPEGAPRSAMVDNFYRWDSGFEFAERHPVLQRGCWSMVPFRLRSVHNMSIIQNASEEISGSFRRGVSLVVTSLDPNPRRWRTGLGASRPYADEPLNMQSDLYTAPQTVYADEFSTPRDDPPCERGGSRGMQNSHTTAIRQRLRMLPR